ncbi:hypothetical protein NBRC3280_0693 [Acetobacter pasteurianus NBRC 3280]|uniref:hypothetical protein n=1 Tax=Acetobacter pasteurianus TaxID=438 RepID=UPI000FF95F9D|nr:hypothetical protein [Acetobacter pasteurianus]GCD58210.1 hypothetical protein NBRC3277_0785 [Acetobacter pasteurianus NBRC 3277]GCD68058.1 hypothetical protein NBRC3280_0693 [Acetobacter pasteurianus NBRC 3280]
MINTREGNTDTKDNSVISFGMLPYISLSRQPNTKQSRELVSFIVGLLIKHRNSNPKRRKVGPKAAERLQRQAGAVIAGLCYGCIQRSNKAVEAPKAFEADFWKRTSNLVGNEAFWSIIADLEALGLVEVIKRKCLKGNDGSFIRRPLAIVPTSLFQSLAIKYGCSRRETIANDWAVCPPPKEQSKDAIEVSPFRLLTFGHWPIGLRGDSDHPRGRIRNTNAPLDAQTALKENPTWDTAIEEKISLIERLNKAVLGADIQGCIQSPLYMRQGPKLWLGGRLYTKGPDTFQTITKEERKHITINGEPVAEVDIQAASLSIALRWFSRLPDIGPSVVIPPLGADPYQFKELSRFPRDAIKHWVTVSLLRGKLLTTHWPDDTPPTIRDSVRCSDARKAVLNVYPCLSQIGLNAIPCPSDVLKALPIGISEAQKECFIGWAFGQFLISLECFIIQGALDKLLAEGIVALPLHDGLIVPQSAVEATKEAIRATQAEPSCPLPQPLYLAVSMPLSNV